jgi:hypothetical protein
VARTGTEGCVGAVGTAFLRRRSPLLVFIWVEPCIGHDDEFVCDARRFSVNRGAKPIGEPKPDRVHGMVELRELIGSVALFVIWSL